MIIEVLKLDEPLHLIHAYKASELDFKSTTARLQDEVLLDTLVTREQDNSLLLEGKVKTAIKLTCCRCLKDFSSLIDQSFNLSYEPMGLHRRDIEKEITYADMNTAYYDGEHLDIDAIVLEQLELSVPMKPVCKDSCKGLCEICGQELNLEGCDCSRDEIDQRLLPLLDLKKRLER